MKKFTKIVMLAMTAILFSGCASTPYTLKTYRANFDKAKAGDLEAIYEVTRAHCLGLEGYDGNKEKTFIYPRADICLPWWEKLANELPAKMTEQTQIYATFFPFTAFEIAKLPYSDKDIARLEAIGNKMYTNYHPMLVEAQYVIYSTSMYRYENAEQKRAGLAKLLCDKDGIGCEAYASYAYSQGDFLKAVQYYERGEKSDNNIYTNLEAANYGYHLSQLILEHRELLPPTLQQHSPLKLQETYFWSMKLHCGKEKHNSVYGLSSGDCGAFKRLSKNKDAVLQKTRLEMAFIEDQTLPAAIRQDKYKLGITKNLKAKDYATALLYFDFLERTGFELPSNMLYHKAEALVQVNDEANAKKAYLEYVTKAGKSGAYYRQALSKLNEL